MLRWNINALTCSWYVSNTYNSPVNVYVTATFCIGSAAMYWFRLGPNRYRTNTHLPGSYSRGKSLFRTRSAAISLVTSKQKHSNLECYYALLRRPITNGSVVTHSILFSNTAMRSATSDNVTFPERPSRNEKPTSRNEEQTKNVLSSYLVLPQNLFSEIICILFVLEHEILSFSAHFVIFLVTNWWIILQYFPLIENVWCKTHSEPGPSVCDYRHWFDWGPDEAPHSCWNAISE